MILITPVSSWPLRLRGRRPSWSLIPLAEAQIDELSGNPEGSIKGYLKAIELGMDGPEVIRRAVQLLFDRRRYIQADELMRKLQERGFRAEDSRLPRLAAEVSLQVNDRSRALDLARKAAPADSTNYRDHLWLGQILWAAGEKAKAEPELRRAVELAGGAPDALITLVQYLTRTERKDQAQRTIEDARGRLSGNSFTLALAQCYAEVGNLDQARAHSCSSCSQQDPDDVAALRADAVFALNTGSIDQAEHDLRKIVDLQTKACPKTRRGRAACWRRCWHRAATAASRSMRLDSWASKTRGASYVPPDGEPVDEIRAKAKVLSLRNNRDARRAAIRALQQIIEREQPTPDDEYLLCQLYQADGNWPKAEGQLKSLLARHDENPAFLAHYVMILLHDHSPDEAQGLARQIGEIESATRSAPLN